MAEKGKIMTGPFKMKGVSPLKAKKRTKKKKRLASTSRKTLKI